MKELIIEDNLPLIVDGVSRIPNDIEKIILCNQFNQPLIVDGIKALPGNLRYLIFQDETLDGTDNIALPHNPQSTMWVAIPQSVFNQPLIVDGIKALPDNLQHIEFGIDFNQPLIVDGVKALPDSLQSISFDSYFNQPLIVDGIKALPDSLQSISFGDYFNQPLMVDGIKALPDNLQHIEFYGKFNQPLMVDGIKSLPDNLQHVRFGGEFNQHMMVNGIRALPHNLKEIIKYGKPLDLFHIPLSVNKIIFISRSNPPKIDLSCMLVKFKTIYDTLPFPIAEEIAYYMHQEI